MEGVADRKTATGQLSTRGKPEGSAGPQVGKLIVIGKGARHNKSRGGINGRENLQGFRLTTMLAGTAGEGEAPTETKIRFSH